MAATHLIGTEVDLSCSICKRLFKDPRMAKCGHSFCRVCLDGVLAPMAIQQEDATHSESDSSAFVSEFTCPFPGCERKSRLRSADIEEFPPNCSLAEIVKLNSSNEGELKTRCRIHHLECQMFCVHCKKEICVKCLTDHRNAPHSPFDKEEAVGEFQNRAKQHIEQACADLESLNVKVAKVMSMHEDEGNVMQEFVKLENIFQVLDDATPFMEDIKVKLCVELLRNSEGNTECRNLRKDARENATIQNAIGFLSRAVQKPTANVFDAIECEQMALDLKLKANSRLRESSQLERRDFSARVMPHHEELVARGINDFIGNLNPALTRYEILLQEPQGIPCFYFIILFTWLSSG